MSVSRRGQFVTALGVMFACAVVVLGVASPNKAVATLAPHEHSPHEHLPHSSRAVQDVAAFTKTFSEPPPKPGSPTTPLDVRRVRLANSLPPADNLSTPVVGIALGLVLFGCLLYPFRKARRRSLREQTQNHGPEDPPHDPDGASFVHAAAAGGHADHGAMVRLADRPAASAGVASAMGNRAVHLVNLEQLAQEIGSP
jgi:hypothetical protein